MKEPKDIKTGIEKCLSEVFCQRNCPYAEYGTEKCIDELHKDVVEYIAQLEERIAIMTEVGRINESILHSD